MSCWQCGVATLLPSTSRRLALLAVPIVQGRFVCCVFFLEGIWRRAEQHNDDDDVDTDDDHKNMMRNTRGDISRITHVGARFSSRVFRLLYCSVIMCVFGFVL